MGSPWDAHGLVGAGGLFDALHARMRREMAALANHLDAMAGLQELLAAPSPPPARRHPTVCGAWLAFLAANSTFLLIPSSMERCSAVEDMTNEIAAGYAAGGHNPRSVRRRGRRAILTTTANTTSRSQEKHSPVCTQLPCRSALPDLSLMLLSGWQGGHVRSAAAVASLHPSCCLHHAIQ